MEKQLRKEAEEKVAAKLAFHQCLIIFTGVSLVLVILSFYLVEIALWLLIPIPIFIMVLGVLYVSAFGFSFNQPSSGDWREEEVQKEMDKLRERKKQQLPPLDDLSAAEVLELKELDRLQRKWNTGEDYV